MRKVPYYTTDDENEPCGHIWRQRSSIGGVWGFAWEVIPAYDDKPKAHGWRRTQESAEQAMNAALQSFKPKESNGKR